jgi:hypothetical protein
MACLNQSEETLLLTGHCHAQPVGITLHPLSISRAGTSFSGPHHFSCRARTRFARSTRYALDAYGRARRVR